MGDAVTVTWHGHSCVEVRYQGVSLLFDPHDGGSLGVGFRPPAAKPDYVVVTHDHYDHNAVDAVRHEGLRQVLLWRDGVHVLEPFRLRGVKLPHDPYGGRLRGTVTAYRVMAGDIVLVHLSDAGRRLEPEEAAELGPADVVFAPAGGVYTMHPREALESAELLGAKVLVPIHYWLPGVQLPLEPLDLLLGLAKGWRVLRLDGPSFEVARGLLPDRRTIVVPRLAR